MSSITLFRLSGWATILSGLCLLVDTLLIETLLPETVLSNSVGHLSIVFGFFALMGIYLWQRSASGALGDIGFIVNFLGLILLSGVMFFKNYIAPYLSKDAIQLLLAGPPRLVILLSVLIFGIGVVLFGVAMLRARSFPRPAAVLYMTGYIAFVVEPFVPNLIAVDLAIRIAQVIGAMGVIWLGYTLRSDLRAIKTAGITRSFPA